MGQRLRRTGAGRLRLLGCPVTAVIPLSVPIGNVTVSFTVLSYAGDLTITVNADPQACPDLAFLRTALTQELAMAVEVGR